MKTTITRVTKSIALDDTEQRQSVPVKAGAKKCAS